MFKCRSPTKILGLSVDGNIFQHYIQYPLLHNIVSRAGPGQAALPQLHDGEQEQRRPLQPGDQPAEVREEQEAEAAEGEDQAACGHCSAPCTTYGPSCRCRGRQVRGCGQELVPPFQVYVCHHGHLHTERGRGAGQVSTPSN